MVMVNQIRVKELEKLIANQQHVISDLKQEIFRLKNVINKIQGSVYWKNQEGVYLGCNEFVLEIAGLKNERDIIGKTDFELPWYELAEEYRAVDQTVIREKRSVSVEEQILINGVRITVLTNKSPLLGSVGD
jgi:two-component system, OmpR family, aerobic respiration control sensor histidine kinase ArcB